MLRRRALAALLALGSALPSGPAAAHPHVWIEVRSELMFNEAGKVAAVRHHWTFDEGYSTVTVQGLDANGDGRTSEEELKQLAETNVSALGESGYFTVLKANGVKQAMDVPRNAGMSFENGRLTLRFEVLLKSPAAGKLLGLEVYDPTFFVDFQTAAAADAVRLDGAPAGCSLTVSRPKPVPTEANKSLSESFFQNLSASSSFGASFASRTVVACP
ncbi:DUF1007 family protein [Enterovirga sp.]|uniref:DUF1007 family protein n=1 Tax=Enterovirga sp. TaxID=2026350 RepID=UPI0026210E7F|nr:DUF1007 family protein [Enterovirga sp.]